MRVTWFEKNDAIFTLRSCSKCRGAEAVARSLRPVRQSSKHERTLPVPERWLAELEIKAGLADAHVSHKVKLEMADHTLHMGAKKDRTCRMDRRQNVLSSSRRVSQP